MIIGLSGYIGSGKDTVAQMIIDSMGSYEARDDMGAGSVWRWHNGPWVNKKFAAKLKQVASLLTGIPIENFENQEFKKTYLPSKWSWIERHYSADGVDVVELEHRMTVREFLQKLGTEAMRENLHENVWVNALFADYGKRDNWIVSDVRFPNEAQAVKNFGGVLIRIERNLPDIPYKRLEQLHPSETSLDEWEFDYRIFNNGTLEDLRKVVESLLLKMKEINLVKI